MTDYYKPAIESHRKTKGKFAVTSLMALETQEDLSIAYTPGVAGPCHEIADAPGESYALTMKGRSVAVLSDGTAVLGLGNIGPAAALPVIEGKAVLFKAFADIDAVPICVDIDSDEALIAVGRAIAPTFGGINLEDIAAPRCFVVENALQDIGIPVFHDDQHGTAIVLLAALKNASRVVGKSLTDMTIVISGAGAAGTAIAKILRCINFDTDVCMSVREVLVCDSKGLVSPDRDNLSSAKKEILGYSNRTGRSGTLQDALAGADAFIGVSRGGLLCADDIRRMADDPIILAMANPEPEIMPDEAKRGGAAVVGTGRSDFPNQVNNVLAFPGIFRGALDAHAVSITQKMKMAAVNALAESVSQPTADRILPDPLDKTVAPKVAQAVQRAYDGG